MVGVRESEETMGLQLLYVYQEKVEIRQFMSMQNVKFSYPNSPRADVEDTMTTLVVFFSPLEERHERAVRLTVV